MLVPKMTVSWYFPTNFAATKLCLALAINQSYNIQLLDLLSPLYNRVVSLGLALVGAVLEHTRNCNFFSHAGTFFGPIVTGTCNNLMLDERIRQENLLITLIQSFGSQLFLFFRSGIMPTCRGLTLRQGFPYILGTTLGFNLTRCKKGQVHTLLET